MEKHPIESLMGVSMEQIKDMVDVNTVIGDAVQTQDGSTIIPISRVSFGFVAGGGEYAVSGAQAGAYGLPFAGGAGAGVSIHPMGFLVCGRNGVRLLSAAPRRWSACLTLSRRRLKTGSGWATSRKTRNRLRCGRLIRNEAGGEARLSASAPHAGRCRRIGCVRREGYAKAPNTLKNAKK